MPVCLRWEYIPQKLEKLNWGRYWRSSFLLSVIKKARQHMHVSVATICTWMLKIPRAYADQQSLIGRARRVFSSSKYSNSDWTGDVVWLRLTDTFLQVTTWIPNACTASACSNPNDCLNKVWYRGGIVGKSGANLPSLKANIGRDQKKHRPEWNSERSMHSINTDPFQYSVCWIKLLRFNRQVRRSYTCPPVGPTIWLQNMQC
jgi:hypothetical protein